MIIIESEIKAILLFFINLILRVTLLKKNKKNINVIDEVALFVSMGNYKLM